MTPPLEREAPKHCRSEWLRNPIWYALSMEQASISSNLGWARRFQAAYIPFAGLAVRSPEAFYQLHALLRPQESIYLTGEEPFAAMPSFATTGLQLIEELPCLQMVYGAGVEQALMGGLEDAAPRIDLLTADDLPEMLKLKEVAFPGYYGPRAPSLGTYYGIRIKGDLIAMAGERLALPRMREVSAVCTHPDYTGRGYAARLIRKLVSRHLQAGILSLLHVAAENHRAISLYERLGFTRSRALFFQHIQKIERLPLAR